MEKMLELTIKLCGKEFDVEVYEPESGDFTRIESPYSPDEHPEFDQKMGNEIYSWLSLWQEEAENEETV